MPEKLRALAEKGWNLYFNASDALTAYRAYARQKLTDRFTSEYRYDNDFQIARRFLWDLPKVAYWYANGQFSLVTNWFKMYPLDHSCWESVYPFFLKACGLDAKLPQ